MTLLGEEGNDIIAGLSKDDIGKVYKKALSDLQNMSHYSPNPPPYDELPDIAKGDAVRRMAKDQGWAQESDEVAQVKEYIGTL